MYNVTRLEYNYLSNKMMIGNMMTMHIQFVQIQDHASNSDDIPTQYLTLGGDTLELTDNSINLLQVLFDYEDGEDWDKDGFLTDKALRTYNNMKHIQIIQATEHMDWMENIPVQILLVDGKEVIVENDTSLISTIMGEISEEDLDKDGDVRSQALNVLNEMLDRGHPDFDFHFYQAVLESVE